MTIGKLMAFMFFTTIVAVKVALLINCFPDRETSYSMEEGASLDGESKEDLKQKRLEAIEPFSSISPVIAENISTGGLPLYQPGYAGTRFYSVPTPPPWC